VLKTVIAVSLIISLSIWSRCNSCIRDVLAGGIPDLTGTETAFKFGYATIVIAGTQRVECIEVIPSRETLRHLEILKYLFSRGLPPDIEDIAGHTALHHVTMNYNSRPDPARLLQSGANVNHRNRYGETPICAYGYNGKPNWLDRGPHGVLEQI
jgi:hypothetical protein